MVDVSNRPETLREAVADGTVSLSMQAYQLVRDGKVAKGDVLGVARIAGIMAAKKVDYLIPLTHPLTLNKVEITYKLNDPDNTIVIEAYVTANGKTGVEMEALTAVSVAALTIYDMCKAVDRSIVINNIRLLRKTGGRKGTFIREGGKT